jgi:glycosyltransferase involved in cell wall biosynthesis
LNKVTVLLALYNGEKHLNEQLESLRAQKDVQWRLVVSDDGSIDNGPEMVRKFASQLVNGDVVLIKGLGKGSAWNFRHLIDQAPENSMYVALCDQDDVWLPRKLSRAVIAIETVTDSQMPVLYCSRTIVCDEALKKQRKSRKFRRPLGFANAMVENIASGNTIVLNLPAISLLKDVSRAIGNVAEHDWWIYQTISGAGGQIIHDDTPSLLYRQHGRNQIGANDSIRSALTRVSMLFQNRYKNWNDCNITALSQMEKWLTNENRALLKAFSSARKECLIKRISGLISSGVYRQTIPGIVAFWVAAALGKV